MSRKFAEGTTVNAGRTKGEIEDMLTSRGIEQFGSLADKKSATVMFSYRGLTYKITIDLPDREDQKFSTYMRGSIRYEREPHVADKLWSDEVNRKWRALAAVIKAKLIAVDEGITTFEDEFLSHIVTDNGDTLGARMIPQVKAAALEGRMPSALALPGGSNA